LIFSQEQVGSSRLHQLIKFKDGEGAFSTFLLASDGVRANFTEDTDAKKEEGKNYNDKQLSS